MPNENADRQRTAQIVVAYLRHHKLSGDQLGTLISDVHQTLGKLGKAHQNRKPPAPPPSRSAGPFNQTLWFVSTAAGKVTCCAAICPRATVSAPSNIARAGTYAQSILSPHRDIPNADRRWQSNLGSGAVDAERGPRKPPRPNRNQHGRVLAGSNGPARTLRRNLV
jgi:ROS/MUCR transcriptional regulator protein